MNGHAAQVDAQIIVLDCGRIEWPDLTEKGHVKGRSQANIAAFLAHAGVELAHNEFAYRTIVRRQGRELVLDDASAESLWLEADKAGLASSLSYFCAVLEDMGRRNGFHPVRQYLDGLEWDGIGRLDTWLHTYLGALDPEPDRPEDASQEEKDQQTVLMRELVQQYGRKTLIGAVRRVREPGCKHDTLLVLQGKQGLGKSTAIKALCPDKNWFTDSLKIGEDKKTIIELTTGCWLIIDRVGAAWPKAVGQDPHAVRGHRLFVDTLDRDRCHCRSHFADEVRSLVANERWQPSSEVGLVRRLLANLPLARATSFCAGGLRDPRRRYARTRRATFPHAVPSHPYIGRCARCLLSTDIGFAHG
jgi:hypothetical protein